MKLIVPDYYPYFLCKADKCRHTCCVGWEIGVDPASRARYAQVEGDMGRRLREAVDEENCCFRLDENERCPFLNGSGLCDIIINLGEDALCHICADHPRFRNYLEGRTEMGLGLSCEAAAELILTRKEPMTLMALEADGDEEDPADEAFLQYRGELLAMAQDRSVPVQQRVDRIMLAAGMEPEIDLPAWADKLLTLERLDPAWEMTVARLYEEEKPHADMWEIPLEQLLCYLLYRHLPNGIVSDEVKGWAACCCVLWKLLRGMLRDDLPEIARQFSTEIEYSDENLWAIMEEIDFIFF